MASYGYCVPTRKLSETIAFLSLKTPRVLSLKRSETITTRSTIDIPQNFASNFTNRQETCREKIFGTTFPCNLLECLHCLPVFAQWPIKHVAPLHGLCDSNLGSVYRYKFTCFIYYFRKNFYYGIYFVKYKGMGGEAVK